LISAVLSTVLAVGVVTTVGGTAQAESSAPAADPVASTYTPVSPVRVLDTRSGPAVGPGGTVRIDLSSRLPADATAVVLNVTGIALTAPTYVTAFPAGSSRPSASNLNLVAGETRPNLVTVAVGQNRSVVLYNDKGNAHLLADLAGHYSQSAGDRFTPRQSQRIFSTTIGAGGTAVVDLSTLVPASATAVTVNLTGTGPTANTFVTAWPAGTSRPSTSNLNLVAGRTSPNLATVRLGAGRKLSLYNAVGTVQVIVDLSGFYTPEFGAVFTPVEPARVFDTRTGTGTEGSRVGAIPPRTTAWFHPGEQVPDTAIAAVANLTGVAPTSTYVAVHAPLWTGDHETSVLNLAAGQTAANLAVVPLSAENPSSRNGFYNHNGNTHLIADLAGYFWVPQLPCESDCAYVWGGDSGELGLGRTVWHAKTPTPLFGLPGVQAVDKRVAVKEDGTVWTWGDNRYGRLGNGWFGGNSTVPVRVHGLSDVVAVADANYATLALRADGTVWAWGATVLGRWDPFETAVPLQVPGLTGVTEIAAALGTAYALREDGTVWSWGYNDSGQTGTGSPDYRVPLPTQVSGLSEVTAIAGGYATAYAVRSDGSVWAWGNNGDGELGTGSAGGTSPVPLQVAGLTGVTDVAGEFGNAYALRADGTVWAWGEGSTGQLGSGVDCGFEICVSPPVQVSGLTGVVEVIATVNSAMALDDTGRVWVWGANSSAEHGNGTADGYAVTPVQVPGLPVISALYPGEWSARAIPA
jgi:alpha-tubulin suppressor-like RCC1 family protein